MRTPRPPARSPYRAIAAWRATRLLVTTAGLAALAACRGGAARSPADGGSRPDGPPDARDAAVPVDAAPADAAPSATRGVVWSPDPGNPVLERDLSSWDQAVIEPCVRFIDGRYLMWYSGYLEPLGDATAIAIGLATSPDGVVWERHPQNPILRPGAAGAWNDLRVLSTDVLVETDGSLLLAAYGSSRAASGADIAIGLWRSP